uniref:Uncharacterized protein n=1 Tax=Romanomermis culicivorax TaxID=13658 RepID=A0A915JV11_ROMCU
LNRLRSCQGAQCLTDVVKCTLKRCRSKPLGAAWTGMQSRRNTLLILGRSSFADFGLRAHNLD